MEPSFTRPVLLTVVIYHVISVTRLFMGGRCLLIVERGLLRGRTTMTQTQH